MLREKLWPVLTAGDWDVSLAPAAECCHGEDHGDAITLVSIRYCRRSTLKILRYAVSKPKGVRLDGATVYVVRLGSRGDRRMARPCPECWKKLRQLGVKAVIYSTDGGWERELI